MKSRIPLELFIAETDIVKGNTHIIRDVRWKKLATLEHPATPEKYQRWNERSAEMLAKAYGRRPLEIDEGWGAPPMIEIDGLRYRIRPGDWQDTDNLQQAYNNLIRND